MDGHAQFCALIETLMRWEGKWVRGCLLQVGGRFALGTTHALRTSVRMRWRGELRGVACRPPVAVCRRYALRPQRLRLIFNGGPRLEVDVEQLRSHVVRGNRLILVVHEDWHLILEPVLS